MLWIRCFAVCCLVGGLAPRVFAAPDYVVNIAGEGHPLMGIAAADDGSFGLYHINAQAYLTPHHSMTPDELNDGEASAASEVNTYSGDGFVDDPALEHPDGGMNAFDFLGIRWDVARDGVAAVRLYQRMHGDGGWFGGLTTGNAEAPKVQVSRDGGTTWTDVAGVVDDYLSLVQGVAQNGQVVGPMTFSFPPQDRVDGIRLFGQGGGQAGVDTSGFVSGAEFEVYPEARVAEETWRYVYAHPAGGSDLAYNVAIDSGGAAAVSGVVSTNGKHNPFLFRIAPGADTPAWTYENQFPGQVINDRMYDVMVDGEDNVIGCGYLARNTSPYQEHLAVKFAPDGSNHWERIFSTPAGDTEYHLYAVAPNPAGVVHALGYLNRPADPRGRWMVYTLDTDGNATPIPSTTYNPPAVYSYRNVPQGLAFDAAGGFCTVGIKGSSGMRRHWQVNRYDASYALQWEKTFVNQGESTISALNADFDRAKNPIVVGYDREPDGTPTALAIKYASADGAGLWTNRTGGAAVSLFRNIAMDPAGYPLVCGLRSVDGSNRGVLVRLDPNTGEVIQENLWVDGVRDLLGVDCRNRRIVVAGAADSADGGDIVVIEMTPRAPSLYRIGPEEVTLEVHTSFVDPGVIAWDAFEQLDLSGSVVISGGLDTAVLGVYTQVYEAASAGDAAAPVSRIVHVVDTTPPEISLVGEDVIRVDLGVPFTDPGFTATDNYDADMVSRVEVLGSVDAATAGTYTLTYQGSDTSGNPATPVIRTVRVAPLAIAGVPLVAGKLQLHGEGEVGAVYHLYGSGRLDGSPVWSLEEILNCTDGTLDWELLPIDSQRFFRLERIAP